VINPLGEKVYLRAIARTRFQLMEHIGSFGFYVKEYAYTAELVHAEYPKNRTFVAAMIGATLGILAMGPVGIIAMPIAAIVWHNQWREDYEKAEAFNQSMLASLS
jgi:hypothetical protein